MKTFLLLLLLPILGFAQQISISELKNKYNCEEGLLEINFRSDVIFENDNKFSIELISSIGESSIFEAYVYDKIVAVHLPGQEKLPPGSYSVSINSSNPKLTSNELKNHLEIIDKKYKPEISLIPEEITFTKDEVLSLKFSTKNFVYPLHLQMNGFDEIDLDLPSKVLSIDLPITRSAEYKILNIGVGGCSLEYVEYPEIVRVHYTTSNPRIEWEPKSKDICDASPDLISNRFRVYGENLINKAYEIMLVNLERKIEIPIPYNKFYVVGDRVELPIHELKDIPAGKDYYFKIKAENFIESDLLGPFTIENIPSFTIINPQYIKLDYGQSYKFAVKITGFAPFKFTINNEVFTSFSNDFLYQKDSINGTDSPFYYISNGHSIAGACANIISTKNIGFSTVLPIPPN